jgi:MFS family permease
MLFGFTFVFMMIAETCLALIREQAPRHPVEPAAPLREYLTQLRQLWRHSHAFRHLVLLQWLAAAGALAIPLYTLYATETLHAPASKAGSFLIAAMIGTVVGSAFSAYINDHLSPKLVVQLGMACSTLTPLAALVAPAVGRWAAAPPATTVMLYHSVFLLMGMTVTVGFTGFTSYLLELAPVEARAQYTGLLNSLNAPVVALPILGTWMARATSSPAVFWLACLLCALGAIASLRLPAIGPIRRAAQAD